MLFGTKGQFAIEAHLSQANEYVFIRYCFWVKTRMIGDLEQSTLLTSVILVLESTVAFQGKRSFPGLEAYKAKEVLAYFIHSIWQSDQNPAILGTEYSEEELKKADINSHEGESFQGFYTFLVERQSYDWFLCEGLDTGQISEVKIPKLLFYKLVKQFIEWINSSTMLVLRPGYVAE